MQPFYGELVRYDCSESSDQQFIALFFYGKVPMYVLADRSVIYGRTPAPMRQKSRRALSKINGDSFCMKTVARQHHCARTGCFKRTKPVLDNACDDDFET
jgi:hypothetical protein